jgi:hypothetical protein
VTSDRTRRAAFATKRVGYHETRAAATRYDASSTIPNFLMR